MLAQLLSGFMAFWPLSERRESQLLALSLVLARKRSSNINGINFSCCRLVLWLFFRQHAQSTLARPLLPVFMLPVCVWVSICEWAPLAVCFRVGFLWYAANGSREWVIIDIPIALAPLSSPYSTYNIPDSWPTDVEALWIIALGNGLLASLELRLGKYSNYSIRSMSFCQIERKAHRKWKMTKEIKWRN